ncbi:MAG: ATP-binding protein, partial [Chloroflexi bacterium]|nr:ATP-binding protein [Chloroflexota bacterium]
MQTIFYTCEPRNEVLSGELRDEIFAARLKDVLDGKADPVYQQPATFFSNTYPTAGLKLLLDEALGRLTAVKRTNNAIVRLETGFGGGKTHNLIALYHVAQGHDPGPAFAAPALVPAAGSVHSVGMVGSDLQPRDGLKHRDATTYTLWGELAYQLAGVAGYAEVAGSDQDRSAPGTAALERLVGDRPTLILLDEVARHLRAAKAVPTVTKKSDLAEQTVAFLNSLLEFAASRERVVVVLTLAESGDPFSAETEELRQALSEALRLSARQERVIRPTEETDIAAIVTHRLFAAVDSEAARQTATAYANGYRRMANQGANLPQRAIRAEYSAEIVAHYPFHPELLNTLQRKTSTIPSFQKTRGALRLLARVVRGLWETQ